jgi:multidrug efflux pump subunit AcrA (membrane-fusion protein)
MTKLNRLLGRRRKTWLLAGVILLAMGGAVIAYQANESTQAPEPQWLRAEPKSMILRLGLVGRLEPASLVTFTAPFDGTVQEKIVEEGQRVERGQVLLRLDTTQLEIQLREALASLLKAKRAVHEMTHWTQGQEVARARRAMTTIQMNLSDTERKLAETSALLTRGIVPRMEVDSLEQQVNAQRLDLAAAQAEYKLALGKGSGEDRQIAEMELANASARYDALRVLESRRELVAPFAGIIMRVSGVGSDRSPTEPVQRGARVSRGQPLFGLASLEQLRVVAKVEEVDINLVQEGQLVEITGDGFDSIALSGNIASVGAQVVTSDSPGSGTSYDVIVAMPTLTAEQQKRLKLGMSAKLSIVTYQNDAAIVIPPEAIQKDGKQLFVEHSDTVGKTAQRIVVKAGRVTAEGVEVFGLKPGYVRKTIRP